MAEHSEAYYQVKNQILNAKNGQVNIVTPQPIDHDEAVNIFRGVLHKLVNDAYLDTNSGITETEADNLHNLIEGVVSPDV